MNIPKQSALYDRTHDAYFYDSYSVQSEYNQQTAMELFINAATQSPAWVDALMKVRNSVVSKLGLKDLGALSQIDKTKPSHAYAKGDRVGIFTVVSNTPHEVILEDKDKHLDVQLSFLVEPTSNTRANLHITTVVHVHNRFGKLYMFFVEPVHKLIVPKVLSPFKIIPKEA